MFLLFDRLIVSVPDISVSAAAISIHFILPVLCLWLLKCHHWLAKHLLQCSSEGKVTS